MTINTVKQLKNLIKDLPDEMPVEGVDSAGEFAVVGVWIRTSKSFTEEELLDGYPEGFVDTLYIDLD